MRTAALVLFAMLSAPALAMDEGDTPSAPDIEVQAAEEDAPPPKKQPPVTGEADDAGPKDAEGAPEDLETPEEAPQEAAEPEADEAEAQEEVVPDEGAEALEGEAAERLEALQSQVLDDPAPEEESVDEGVAAGWSYQDGRLAGAEDARRSTGYNKHGLLGLAGGLVCGPCGCVGVPAAELLMSPSVPRGTWQGNDAAYQRGYIDGYRGTTRNKRAIYALVGSAVGTGVAFGVGYSLAVYGLEFPFIN